MLIGAMGVAAMLLLADVTPAPFPLTASLDTTATTVGGTLSLTVEMEEADGWMVDPPTKALSIEPFRVRSVERLARPSGAAWRLRIVALEAGETEVPAIGLTARGPAGETAEALTSPIPVTVASNLPPPEGEEPAEPEPAALKSALEAERNWIPLGIAAVAAAVAATLGFWLFRKLRSRGRPAAEPEAARRKPLRPAWEAALEELDRIAARDHVARGEIGLQYVEVTGALRRYLEDRYGVPALESTTADLNEQLRRTPLHADTSARILSLLREADLVKFAKAAPEAAEARGTEGRARDLVLATIPKPAERSGNGSGAPA